MQLSSPGKFSSSPTQVLVAQFYAWLVTVLPLCTVVRKFRRTVMSVRVTKLSFSQQPSLAFIIFSGFVRSFILSHHPSHTSLFFAHYSGLFCCSPSWVRAFSLEAFSALVLLSSSGTLYALLFRHQDEYLATTFTVRPSVACLCSTFAFSNNPSLIHRSFKQAPSIRVGQCSLNITATATAAASTPDCKRTSRARARSSPNIFCSLSAHVTTARFENCCHDCTAFP